MLDSRSLLCFVTCTDGSTYTLRSCIKGGLVEANEQLVDHPELLAQKVCRSGGGGKETPEMLLTARVPSNLLLHLHFTGRTLHGYHARVSGFRSSMTFPELLKMFSYCGRERFYELGFFY